MKYRKLDANGDYVIGTSADFFTNTPEAVAQSVLTRLRLFSAEWFLDLTDGTPWRVEVLGKYTRETYDTVLRQRILSTAGVRSLIDYTSNFDGSTRTLNVSGTLDTIYGEAPFQGTL